MNRNQAISLVLARCGRRETDPYMLSMAIQELVPIQEMKLEQTDFKPWFLLSEFMKAETGVGERRMPLPENFLEEHEEGLLWIQPPGQAGWCKLERGDVDDLELKYGEAEGPPEAYGIVKNYIILFPRPDKRYKLRMRCHLKEPLLIGNFDSEDGTKTNGWFTYAADWIMAELGMVMAGSHIKDDKQYAIFEKEAQQARQRVFIQHEAREEMNRERVKGGED